MSRGSPGAVTTPFPNEVDARAKRFLEGNGFTVTNMKGLGITDSLAIGKMPPQVPYDLAREVDSDECDGIFISCTNFPTAEIIESLERDLGKPVVTSNQATLWACLAG